jgi:adenine-specific DNA-methyltransferase
MPADVCEGVFAHTLWRWVLANYRLDGVITFAPEATPFPDVDTNAIVFLLQHDKPKAEFTWAKCLAPTIVGLKTWVASNFESSEIEIHACNRSIEEALETGLSRPPSSGTWHGAVLGDFAYVLRGIATGANEFFFLTQARAEELHIPTEWLIPAVGRTRDVQGDVITTDTIRGLKASGRPTLLLSLDATPLEALPKPVREYVRHGQELGFNKRSLIGTRKP